MLLLLGSGLAHAAGDWWDYYGQAQAFAKKRMVREAFNAYKNSVCLRSADKSSVRTYGMHFVDYFPHRELGALFLQVGDFAKAVKELEQSLRMEPSQQARDLLAAARRGERPGQEGRIGDAERTLPEETRGGSAAVFGRRLAVLDIESVGPDKAPAEVAGETLRTELAGSSNYYVLERKFLQKILDEQRLQMDPVVDESTAVKIGRLMAAESVILGSMANVGSRWVLNVRMVDVETGRTVSGKSFDTKNLTKVHALAKKAAAFFDR
ncbi:MAG: hypothetical protein HY927_01280 [Elusimicrobia bacterium]|nr:hypothetical protein [Elusimicrobiota bacterium]